MINTAYKWPWPSSRLLRIFFKFFFFNFIWKKVIWLGERGNWKIALKWKPQNSSKYLLWNACPSCLNYQTIYNFCKCSLIMTIKESSIHNKVSNYGYIIAAISLFCYCLHWWLCIVSAVCNWKGVTVLGNREFTSKYLPSLSWWHPPKKSFILWKK